MVRRVARWPWIHGGERLRTRETGERRQFERLREGAALPRWFSYAAIFVITAFVLHAFLLIVSLAAGMVSADSLLTMAGPVTFIVEFGLAAVITWLIVRPRGETPLSEKEERVRDAALEDDARRRVQAIEQQYAGRTAPGPPHGRGGGVAQGARPTRLRRRGAGGSSATVTSPRPTAGRCAKTCSGRSTTPTASTPCAAGASPSPEAWRLTRVATRAFAASPARQMPRICAFLAANSSSVSRPWSFSADSFWIWMS